MHDMQKQLDGLLKDPSVCIYQVPCMSKNAANIL
jgi:hypothetical protein